jgi:hypothetical protein
MWGVGFRRFMKLLLEAFNGTLDYRWKDKGSQKRLVLERKADGAFVRLDLDGGMVYQEQFSWDKLYDLLVPNHKLDLLYLMQDVIREVEEGSHPAMVRTFLNRFMEHLVPTFSKRCEMTIQENKLERETKYKLFGEPFTYNGKKYEQLAFVI